MGKCGLRRNQTKYKSFERFCGELFKNVIFIEFELLCQKLWAFMSNLPRPLTKYGDHSPSDSGFKFRKFLFFA